MMTPFTHLTSRLRRTTTTKLSSDQCRWPILVATIIVLLLDGNPQTITKCLADDSAAAPAFDMSALASLASNIGSNPQIMSLVSNFLDPNANKKQAVGAIANSGQPSDLSDQDPNSIVQQGQSNNEPLRRGLRLAMPDPQQQQQQLPQAQAQAQAQALATGPAPVAAQVPTSATPQPSQFGGLMSMLPGMLSSLSSSGGGSGLAGLLGGLTRSSPQQAATATATSSSSDQNQASQIQQPGSTMQTPSGLSQATASAAAAPAPAMPAVSPGGLGPAQTVINQVLAAYLSRQIPDELIQLGLSGRVPPQLIELALSGQVPPQLIQMIITGQIPMSAINAFLNTMQPGGPSATSKVASSGGQQQAVSSSAASSNSARVFSTTRALFEAMFKRDNNGKPMINVPTLIGNIPLKMPSMPNMRSFGQMVGGTITNVASMIPF